MALKYDGSLWTWGDGMSGQLGNGVMTYTCGPTQISFCQNAVAVNTQELEESWIYLLHRSFSWAVLGVALWAWMMTRRHRTGGTGIVENTVLGIVLAEMVLGVVMAQIHIYSWVQVLHVGLAAVLLTFLWLWCFGLSATRPVAQK